MTYIATFYSHFGAIRFKRLCRDAGIPAELMPVPRNLSSSCGTCVRYGGETPCPAAQYPEEVGKIRAVAQRYREDLGDDFTGTKGKNCRSKGCVQDFTFRTFKDEDYPYMIALYD